MQKHMISLFLKMLATTLCLGTCFSGGVWAQSVNPGIRWKTIETEHAVFIYDSEQQNLVKEYISRFQALAPEAIALFGETPRKAHILLIHPTDIANGSARVVPQPWITLYPSAPLPLSSIGEFRDNAYELLFHEYTHVLNMDPSHGIATPLRWIFGSVARPNMMLPRWYTEGLAVFTESYASPEGGRLSSQYMGGLTRALTLEKRWDDYPLSQLNDGAPDWLGGSRAYFMGGMMWETIVADKGIESLQTLNQRNSRRIPYFLDAPLDDLYSETEDFSWEDLVSKTYRRWEAKGTAQLQELENSPSLRGKPLRPTGFNDYGPSISPNGKWMAYLSRTLTNSDGEIYTIRRHKKRGFRGYRAKLATTSEQPQTVAWHPKSRGFLYESHDPITPFSREFRLWYYDMKTRKSAPAGLKMSGAFPCFSPSGKRVHFVENGGGFQRLRRGRWKNNKIDKEKVIYTPPVGHAMTYLSCHDSGHLSWIEQIPGKAKRVVFFDIKKRKARFVLPDHHPQFLKKIRGGYLMGSDKSGITNVYFVADLENPQSAKAVTNTKTLIQTADLDPFDKTLYFNQFTADGPRLFQLKAAQWESLPDTPPKVSPLYETPVKSRAVANTASVATAMESEKDFSSWPYMLPNHWFPFLQVVDRGVVLQATTTAGDPLGKNAISLLGQWDSLTKRAGGAVNYANNAYRVGFGAGVSDLYSYFYARDSTLQSTNGIGYMRFRMPWVNRMLVSFNWQYSQLIDESSSSSFIRQGPGVSVSYANRESQDLAISFEEGWNIRMGHKNFLPSLGNTSYRETTLNLGTYWSSFTPGRSVFFLGVNGAFVPDSDPLANVFATSTLAGPFNNVQAINTAFLQRGYASGSILAKKIVNINAEFRFPVAQVFRGFRSPPAFLRRLHANWVFDASMFEGIYATGSGPSARTNFDKWVQGTGLELHTETNLGFHVPVAFTLGLYYGLNPEAGGGNITPFFSLRL